MREGDPRPWLRGRGSLQLAAALGEDPAGAVAGVLQQQRARLREIAGAVEAQRALVALDDLGRDARLVDFAQKFALTGEYAGLSTPDGSYFVGLDAASALHPQTLLAYEMNGQPLAPEHGAPLRLVVPVKYGIKSIKRIGTIRFTDARPRDYWAEHGYDWYAGL